MKQLLLSLFFALVALTGLQAQTIWDGTADTEWYDETSTEFEISTAKQLAGLAELVNNGNYFSGKTILLTADIVLNYTSNWGNWESSAPNNTWTPIGKNYDKTFRGTFDGQGHTVSGIYINSENSCQGLFGSNAGTIKNIGVTESYIKGDYGVGGVCGKNWGGTISNCYNSGTVNGDEEVGGVCGENWGGTSSNCYNSGIVNGDSYVGGVCGENNNGTISNCYYLQGTAKGGIDGSDVSGQAEVKTSEQFASGEVCWLLNGSSDANPVWFQTLDTDTYPVFDDTHSIVYAKGKCPNSKDNTYSNQGPSQVGAHTDNDIDGRCDFCGKIMISEPAQKDGVYQISNRAELYWFAGLVNGTLSGVEQNTAANAVLTADIIINENVLDANGNLTESTDNLLVWYPIGNWYSIFSGTFDGQGHTVSGIYYNSENIVCQGLFGHNEGTIKNVGVTESYIKGDYYVGGVCGYNYGGTVSNCYNAGTVNGTGNGESTIVGGVCGCNDGTISNCYNAGTVNGTGNGESTIVGGVCGFNGGTISNCYNTGNVSGTGEYTEVGGVCGYNHSTISNCYYLEGTADGGIYGSDVSGQAEVKTAEQFASGEVCWLLNEKQSEGAWGQKLGTDPCPVLGGPAVFKNGETYYNEEGSAILETNSEQASFAIVSENLTINIYGSDHEATVYNLAGNIVYQGIERIIPVQNPGMYMVRIGNEVQKTIVR